MITFLFILLGFTALCILFINVDMYDVGTPEFILTILIVIFTLLGVKLDNIEPNISLPEESVAISRNSPKPDTLLGYWSNDTLIINFKTKQNE